MGSRGFLPSDRQNAIRNRIRDRRRRSSMKEALRKQITATLQKSPSKGVWTFVVMPGLGYVFSDSGSRVTAALARRRSTANRAPCGERHVALPSTFHRSRRAVVDGDRASCGGGIANPCDARSARMAQAAAARDRVAESDRALRVRSLSGCSGSSTVSSTRAPPYHRRWVLAPG